MKIIIVGGGVIGYCSAWFLSQSGHDITVLENSSNKSNASYGNAGMVVPSHFTPLAAPGIIWKGIKWMLKSDSPFYIKPRIDVEFIKWCWQFYRHSTKHHVNESVVLLRDLNQKSRYLYNGIIPQLGQDISYKPDGLMMIYKTIKAEKEELKTALLAKKLGISTQILDTTGLNSLDTGIEYDARGAVYYPGDTFMDPEMFMDALENKLKERGVEISKGVEVKDFITSKNMINGVETNKGEYQADQIVLCAGIFSTQLASKLGIYIPMQGGKGYSITLDSPERKPKICSILTEAKVAVTPMGSKLRLAGTMEIAGNDMSVRRSRVNGYLKAVCSFMPYYNINDLQKHEVWVGLRPCSPDGLPYIGRSIKYQNLVIATGHAMMGFSLGPVTGELVSQIVDEKEPRINIDKLSPERYL